VVSGDSRVPIAVGAPKAEAALLMVLSLIAGYVDTAGFLSLQGLFTAHVTGNFVTLGASLAFGSSGAIAKVLALPLFCLVVVATRLLNTVLSNRSRPALEILIAQEVLLLFIGAALAIRFGPFDDTNTWQAVLTGMALVGAMAVQNAVHRIHFGSAPPSTIMTGTTTQVMIDLAGRLYGHPGTGTESGARLRRMAATVLSFATGCASAALLYGSLGMKCLLVPPVLGGVGLVLRLTD